MPNESPLVHALLLASLAGCGGVSAAPEAPPAPAGQAAVAEDSVALRVRTIVANELGVELSAVTLDTTFTGLGADSLDFVEILMEVEAAFDVEIRDEDAEKFVRVGDVAEYVRKALRARSG